MSRLVRLYSMVPIPIQHLMTTVAGYKLNQDRYGTTYRAHRSWLRRFDSLDLKEKLEFQANALRDFVQFAIENSAFYRKLYLDHGATRAPAIADLHALPIVDKEALRQNIDSVFTVARKPSLEGHTGGTTGKSLIVRYRRDDLNKRMALLDHFKSRVGFEHRKMRRASFSGKNIIPSQQIAGPHWRYNHACKQMLYSTYHINDSTVGEYVDSLNRFRPAALDGFPSSISELARLIETRNLELQFTPIGIFPNAETLTGEIRTTIERVFKCRVYDQYASAEGAPLITECRWGELHIELSSGVFEVKEDNDLLVTSFTTHGTPLIRYRIGDSVILSDKASCPCGVQGPLVEAILGRSQDFLNRSDGGRVNSANVSNLFKNIPNALIKAQLVQEKLGEIVAFLVVDQNQYSREFDELLMDEFREKFDANTQLLIKHVTDIPKEASGKHRLIKNSLASTTR